MEQEFNSCAKKVKNLSSKPSDSTLLVLYGLYKQATVGNCNTGRPGMFDPRGRAKWDAWNRYKNRSKEEAMNMYIIEVNKLTNN